MLRSRDIAAVLIAVILARMTWQDPASAGGSNSDVSLWAAIHLSFYIPIRRGSDGTEIATDELGPDGAVAVMDLDGDGRSEALAVIAFRYTAKQDLKTAGRRQVLSERAQQYKGRRGSYEIHIMDLKPGAAAGGGGEASSRTITAPFQPKILMSSFPLELNSTHEAVENEEIRPLAMTTGQVVLTANLEDKKHRPTTVTVEIENPAEEDDDDDDAVKRRSKTKTTREVNDRTRKFFCGKDWHDAAQNCRRPCPGGQLSECPKDERCYADTPCDYWEWQDAQKSKSADRYHTTLAGGWPSIWTVWTNGAIVMHSITAEKPDETKNGTAGLSSPFDPLSLLGRRRKGELQLRQMWQVKPFSNRTMTDWEDMKILYVDAVSTGLGHGMLLISGTVDWEGVREDDDEDWVSSFVIALHDQTGELLWQSYDEIEDVAEVMPRPNIKAPELEDRGETSYARRRSFNPNLHSIDDRDDAGSLVPNCLHTYRHSLLKSEAFPTFYEDNADADLRVIHLDHPTQRKHAATKKRRDRGRSGGSGRKAAAVSSRTAATAAGPGDRRAAETARAAGGGAGGGGGAKRKDRGGWGLWTPVSLLWPKDAKTSGKKSRRHHRRRSSRSLLGGRPNAIATNHYEGLQVRSLKNGRSLCHLSLWDNTMYVDLNGDGIIDSVQVVTGRHRVRKQDDAEESNKFLYKLVERVSKLNPNASKAEADAASSRFGAVEHMCHILALSGLPSKEELFSGTVCGNTKRDRHNLVGVQQPGNDNFIEPAKPLVVEPRRGARRGPGGRAGWDVVVALNNGLVHRFHGANGRRVWQLNGNNHGEDFPKWDDIQLVSLERIDGPAIPSAKHRPIVLAGENGAALLSPWTGRVLAQAGFPQPAEYRPLLADWNGDGTDDVLVVTQDAIWGYSVRVHARPSIFNTIMLGILFVAVLLALLRNRFGPHPGKRSTDA